MSNTNNNSGLQEKLDLVKQGDSKDNNYSAWKGILGAAPAGSLFVHFYETYVKEPSRQRLVDFLDELVKYLFILEQQIDAVSFDNPTFQTTLIKARDIAVREHQQEKLEALRNAVLNSAIPNSFKDDIQAIFIKWIEEFTVSHIRLLRILHYIDNYNEKEFLANLPDLEENRIFYNQILKQLNDKDLIELKEVYRNFKKEVSPFMPQFKQPVFGISLPIGRKEVDVKTVKVTEDIDLIISDVKHNRQKSKTTELGKQFIQFIENPLVIRTE
ncbi:MAG: hypothetical protein F6K40_25255 [Okeania sp. SIO3I5]|uniref:hypothetical protein n=1 Tax=Okeania sp. SIO3I5 TaxID=2607805 RepID=UPI0013B76CF5|nr:hypothetical protein [Okeania sp. SIO3I5]NEQ39381.1 hypothetical protein [Okeania sp. SIO3I5]